MSEDESKTTAQGNAEAEVDSFRRDLGPFVVAAETTRMPMIFTDAKVNDNPIIFVNDSFLLLFGYNREEVLGQSFNSLIPHDADQSALKGILAAFESTPSVDPETWYRRKDGSQVWASLLVSPVHDKSGTLTHRFISFIDLTKHKQAAAELQAKSAFLEATLENMDQGIMVMDAENRVKLFNYRALALLDLPPELLANQPLVADVREFQARRGDFAHHDNAAFNLTQSGNFHYEPPIYERTQTNGNVLEVRTVPLPDGGAVRTYANVTTRRRAEEELRASEERYRALVTTTASILWRAAPDGSLFDVVGFDQYRGLQHDLLGTGWLTLVHPDDRERVSYEWQVIVASRQPGEIEFRFGHIPEEFRWVCSRSAPLKDADGVVREWVGTFSDIHEQRQTKETLILRDRALAAIAQGVVITDAREPDHPIIYVNPAFERLTGYPAGDVIGRNCRFLQGSATDRGAVARMRVAVASEAEIHETLVNYRKDGTPFVNEIMISPVRGPDGGTTHHVGTQSDVTDRQRLEEQLRQAQKMEAVGQLTGGLAHDFNNLLTVILGNAEVLNEEPADAAKVESLSKVIVETAERGAELTKHLLTFGRRQALKPVHLRLDEVVQGIVPLLQRTLGEHVELRTEFVPSPTGALVDRTLLESAILNLAVNARDAMPKGGTLTISTSLRRAEPNEGLLASGQDTVFVTVADTGTGMSPETLSHVFEPFFTTKEVGKGSGLGLSMVYGFAQQSGGHVSIKSKEGEGTTVSIILPAVVSQQPEAVATPTTLAATRGKERVLVVEDAPQVLQFVAGQLLSLGYEVTAVANGPDAVALLKKDSAFDVLFTDIVLPRGMSGVELARAARAINPDLKVVYTSGYADEVFQQHGRIGDDIPLLRKPYRRKELADVLRLVLDQTAKPQAHV